MLLRPTSWLAILAISFLLFQTACTDRPENLLRPCERCEIYLHDGLERSYVLHVPDNLPDNAPLVFFLHGYGGKAHQYAWFFQIRDWADENGFAVVVPQGTLDANRDPFWDARLTFANIDDVGFLTGLAQELQVTYNLDPEKTFTSGISNGGFMSYVLVQERPEVWKAAASLIGTMPGYSWENRDMFVPTPLLQLSLEDDETVPIDGSMDTTGGWGGAPHMDDIIEFWTELNGTTEVEVLNPNDHTVGQRYTGGPED
ncbi:MAG TPA: hypothetical protein DCE41_30540, partial [Cytophagales bacterium]|nr:hypothetical protein [Cytophagales bacterium]